MVNKTALLMMFKRWFNILLVAGLAYILFQILMIETYRFNPQYLVDNSILKGQGFSIQVQEIQSPKLKIKAYLMEEHSNPLVNISMEFRRSGIAYDSDKKVGISHILADMLMTGAGKYDIKAFQNLLEKKAIQMDFSAGKNSLYGLLRFISDDRKLAVELFNMALTKPRFDIAQLEYVKKTNRHAYLRASEDAETYLDIQAVGELYKNHPQGRNLFGNPKQMSSVNQADLRAYLKNHITLDNLIIGISGDITAADAGTMLDKMFAGIPQKSRVGKLKASDIDFSAPDWEQDYHSHQYISTFYASAPERSSSDFYPVAMALEVLLGGSLDSRVQQKVREEAGLTYGAYAGINYNDLTGYVKGRFSATKEKFPQLLQTIRDEWQRLGEEGLTRQELDMIKKRFVASDILRYADSQNIANTLVMMQHYNLGADFLQKRSEYIRDVNLEDINNAVKKYFTKDNMRFFILKADNE